MKHLFNGDAAADVFAAAAPASERIVWREALQVGRARLHPTDEAIRERAEFLSRGGDQPPAAIEAVLRAQERDLARAAEGPLTIWVEGDLSCQLTVAVVAHRLSGFVHADVHLISVSSFEGRPQFRGLGELTPAELMTLKKHARRLDRSQLATYAEAWELYCAADPRPLARAVAQRRLSDHLSAALAAHLRRFPRTPGGAGSVEYALLSAIGDSRLNFDELFRDFIEREPLLGYGNTSVRGELELMVEDGWVVQEGETYALTAQGEAARRGEPAPRRTSKWLGGVEVNARSPYLWDGELGAFA